MRVLGLLTVVALIFNGSTALPGSSLCSRGPGHWCSSPEAARRCGATAHCVQLWRNSNLGPAADDASEACTRCQLLAADLDRLAAAGRSQAEMRTAAVSACGLAPTGADACRHLVTSSSGAGLVELISARLQPAKACVLTRQCRRTSLRTRSRPATTSAVASLEDNLLLRGAPLSARRARVPPGTDLCDGCIQVLTAVKTSFGNNSTQAEIANELKTQICPQLGPLIDICNQFADQYLGIVLTQLSQEMQPQQICVMFDFCSTTSMAMYRRHPVLQLMQLQSKQKVAKPLGTVGCEVCEALVSEARKMLRDGSTQAEIEKFVEDTVCNLLPAEKDQCIQNVKEYGPILFQLLASELDPQTVCQALGACGAASAAAAATRKVKAGPQCLLCEFVIREVQQQLGQNSSQAQIEAALDKVCALLPQTVRQECNNFVQQYTPIIVQLLVNGLSPEKVCTTLGLCTQFRHRPMSVRPVATSRKFKAGPQCLMCEFVIREVQQQLGQNSSVTQIEAALEKVCSMLPQTVRQECNNFVQQYTPVIVQLLVNGLSPEKVCTTLGLCTQFRHRRMPVRAVPVASAANCDTCQTVILYVKALLNENATEQEIVQTVEKVCNFLPTAEQAPCRSFVEQYGPYVIQLLLQDVNPKQICQLLGLCPKAQAKPASPRLQVIRAGPQCLMCEFVIREVEQQLGQNSSQAQIEAALDKVCALLPQTVRQECNNFVQQYTPIIVQLLVNGLSPEKVCTTLGLCTQFRHRPMSVRPVATAARAKSPRVSSTACDVCQTVIQYAKTLLSENATEQEIVQLLEKVCNFLPTAEQAACQSFINQYGPYVIQLLLQDVDAKQICQLLGLCSSAGPVQKLPQAGRPFHPKAPKQPVSSGASQAPGQTLRFVSQRVPRRQLPAAPSGLVQMIRDDDQVPLF